MTDPSAFSPPAVRYIKLGEGGAFVPEALSRSILPLAFPDADHELCARGEWEAVQKQLVARGRPAKEARQDIRELRDFYELPDGTLFVTTAHGHLYWATAGGRVSASRAQEGGLQRERPAEGGWRRDSVTGTPLALHALSSALTRTAAYRRTICRVEAEAYLLRCIRGEAHPLHSKAVALGQQMEQVMGQLLRELHAADLEVLTDLLLRHGGWQRISRLGGSLPEADLLLSQPCTGETAWVQVKARARQGDLNEYIRRFSDNGTFDRFIFVCAKPAKNMQLPVGEPQLQLWSGDTLAQRVINAGLSGWVLDRTR